MSNLPLLSRYRGALLGLAAGDALGTTLEFRRPGTFAPIDDIVGGGPFGLPAGAWTDDTSMALCLAESLVLSGGFDAEDQMARYVRWWRNGYLSSVGRCFDIGGTTSVALSRYDATGEPFAGSTNPRTAGNGSLMRLAPAVLAGHCDAGKLLHYAGESSRTTHGAKECVDGCRFFAVILTAALDGADKSELGRLGGDGVVSAPTSRLGEIMAGSYLARNPPTIRGTGYVLDCLEAALWAFHRSEDFRSGALLAVNLGDDADTTGAVYGQIGGAYYGEDGIPAEWRAKLVMRETIESLAEGLYRLAGHAP